MAETALTFNEHDIHLITKEIQGSLDNAPEKTHYFIKKIFKVNYSNTNLIFVI